MAVTPVEKEIGIGDGVFKGEERVFREGKFTFGELNTLNPNICSAIFGLRVETFAKDLGWVDPTKEAQGDKYDPYCFHLGVIEGEVVNPLKLVGYVRLLRANNPLNMIMLEDQEAFRPIIADTDWKCESREATLELSRLVVIPELRGKRQTGNFLVEDYLYKLLFQKAVALGLEEWILEVRPVFFKYLIESKGFLFKKIGEHTFSSEDGTKTRTFAAQMNLEETITNLVEFAPNRVAWMGEDIDYARVPQLGALKTQLGLS